jgi:hypothetical protein
MRFGRWLKRKLGPKPESSTLVNRLRAAAFGSATEIELAGANYDTRRRDEAERAEARQRAAAVSEEIAEGIKRDGWWIPPSSDWENNHWERFR